MNSRELTLMFLAQAAIRSMLWLALIAVAAIVLRRASAASRTLVWRTAFVGLAAIPLLLFLMPGVPIRFPDPRAPSTPVIEQTAAAPLSEKIETPTPPVASTQIRRAEVSRTSPVAAPTPVVAPAAAPNTVPTSLCPRLSLADAQTGIIAIWVAGLLWALASLALSAAALMRLARETSDPTDALMADTIQLAHELGVKRRIRVRVAGANSEIQAPVTWGANHPVIVLPADYASQPTASVRPALLHELAHIRHFDWAWLILSQLVCSVYWCVPFVWLAARRLRRDSEMLCDDCVLSAGIAAPDYAAQLLQIARTMSDRHARLPYSTLAMARPPLAESRIRAVLDSGRDRRRVSRPSLILTSIAAGVAMSALSLRAVSLSTRGESPDRKRAVPESALLDSRAFDLSALPGAIDRLASNSTSSAAAATLRTAMPDASRHVRPTGNSTTIGPARPISSSDVNSGRVFRADSSTETLLSDTRIHWGAPQSGIQAGLAIDGDRKVFKVGEKVRTRQYWRNASNRPIEFRCGTYSPRRPATEIQTVSGAHVGVPNLNIEIPPLSTVMALKPGEAISATGKESAIERRKQGDIDLTAFLKPGKYRIRAMGVVAPNNGWAHDNAGPYIATLPKALYDDLPHYNSWPSRNSVPSFAVVNSDWIAFEVVERLPATNSGMTATAILPGGLRSRVPLERDATSITWGPVAGKLQAGLRLAVNKTTVAPGEAIWQEAYLRNMSANDVTVTASKGYEEQGAPQIINEKGEKIKILRYFGIGVMFIVSKTVHPGEIALVGRFAVAFHTPDEDERHEPAPGISSVAQGMPLALVGAGEYKIAQVVIANDVKDGRHSISLITGTIPIKVEGKPVRVIPADPNHFVDVATAPIAWGPAKSGLQAGLISIDSKAHYYFGERVRVAVILRNLTAAPISIWHETAFAFLDLPEVIDPTGTKCKITPALETEWRTLHEISMTGVTYDMTFAPSADGPSRLRRSEIRPGGSVIGYYLTAFVLPAKIGGQRTLTGKYSVVQPVRLGLGENPLLDTTLDSGRMTVDFKDPDRSTFRTGQAF